MKKIPVILSAALLTAAVPALARSAPSGEEQLARMLAGRVAGPPAHCINDLHSSQDVQVIDRVGLVFKAGSTIWVARAADPDSIRDRDILVIDRWTSGTLCRDDQMRMVDRYDGALKSIVFLDDFVPYRRA